MKKILMILFVFGIAQIGLAQKVNDKVKIKYEGKWYDGRIEKVNDKTHEFYIAYDGWGDDMKEWVKIDRLKIAAIKPKAAPKADTKPKK